MNLLREISYRKIISGGWDESQHPREPAGSSEGGEFGPGGSLSTEQLEAKLRTMRISARKALAGGAVIGTRLVTFADGSKGVFKPASGEVGGVQDNIGEGLQTEREIGAWQVAKLVGMEDMATPIVERKVGGERGSVQAFKPGAVAAGLPRDQRYPLENIFRAAAFDYVIGNEDRGDENWLVDGKKLYLIDHSLSFPDSPYEPRGGGAHAFIQRVITLEQQGVGGKLPGALAKSYVKSQGQILTALQKLGLSTTAVEGVKKRIGELAGAKKWGDLG